jgi:YaiO family outer membrane protein
LHRVETSLLYEYLTPNDAYGEWQALNVTYFKEVSPRFNWHAGITAHYRDETALLLFGGIGVIWAKRLFSNFAASFGTKCDYLQEYRFDADINLKLLKSEALIATLGYAYVNYHTVHEDIIWRYGCSLYLQRLVFELMFYNNTSKPGDIKSSTTLFSAGYGEEGWQWTYLIFNFGEQSYLATYVVGNPEIVQDSNEITLKHRHWLKKDFGWFASLGYMELGLAYEKFLFQFGFFWQW